MGWIEIRAIMINIRAKKGSKQVIEKLKIQKGDFIADIGSGGGYLTCEFAKKVGKNGRVFAIDTDEKLLKCIDKLIMKKNIQNVRTLVSDEDGVILSKGNCDLIFMRNVFHHIKDQVAYFKKMKENLKPGGRIAIVEWSNPLIWSHISGTNHSTPENKICQVMQEAGFQNTEKFDFLDGQSFNIFKSVD